MPEPSRPTAPGPGRTDAFGRAPGKLILLGEHAVVYGELAIAMPFEAVEARARLTVRPGPLRLETPFWSGNFARAHDVPEALAGLAGEVLAALADGGGPESGLVVALDATIPRGAGLGSSAAVAVALARALLASAGELPSPARIQALARVAERHAHGNPSGVDTAAVSASGPLAFQRDAGARALAVGGRFSLVVANCGEPGDTRAAVAGIARALARDERETRAHLRGLGALVAAGERAIALGDASVLGETLDAAHGLLAALGVSHPALERLLRAARAAGALGAKLTGAGCGGCIVALAPLGGHGALDAALREAGACDVWPVVLEASGS